MSKTYSVAGMTCGGCARSVEQAIKGLKSDAVVTVDVSTGRVTVNNGPDDAAVEKAVDDAGFTFGGPVAA
jgi:copper chaperone